MTESTLSTTSIVPARLLVEEGEHEGMIFPLREEIVSIGRGPDNTIQIIDTRMSRRHCLLICTGTGWMVRDQSSKNGTQVNNHTIEGDYLLHHGDRIQVGDTAVVYEQETRVHEDGRSTGIQLVEDEGMVIPSQVLKVGDAAERPKEPTRIEDVGDDGQRLRALYEVAEMVNTLLDQDELLDKIIDLVQSLLEPHRTGILLYDERYDILVPKVIRRPAGSEDDIVISNSIINRASDEQVAVLVSDAPQDYRFKASDSIVIQKIQSAICAPLIFKGEVLGVMYLDRRRPAESYEEGDLKLVAGIANQAAMSIANSRMHRRLLERHAQERELEIARSIQQQLMPREMPKMQDYQISGRSRAARMVGGDYFDVIPTADGRYMLTIADVSGKGVPAALLISAVRAAVQVEVSNRQDLPLIELADRLNQMIFRDTNNNMFVTMVLAELDPKKHTLSYCNAGHSHPLLYHPEGHIDTLEVGGCLLGVMPGAPYEAGEVELPPGSSLVFFSDGVTDTVNEAGDMFGLQRLIDALTMNHELSAAELDQKISDLADEFRGDAEPFDDFTILVLRRRDEAG